MILAKKSKNNAQISIPEPLANETVQRDVVSKVIENEIECPRCNDIMTLCSDFDSLYYACESCDFYLYTIKK